MEGKRKSAVGISNQITMIVSGNRWLPSRLLIAPIPRVAVPGFAYCVDIAIRTLGDYTALNAAPVGAPSHPKASIPAQITSGWAPKAYVRAILLAVIRFWLPAISKGDRRRQHYV